MIALDFAYAQPDTKEQAAALYREYGSPLYYGGGSEIISMCRAGSVAPGAVIDLKQIPEANALGIEAGELVIGGCVTLRAIKDSGYFPLLGAICGRIADHTNQCRITLGGNLCGTIIYRETVQALLLAEAQVTLFGPKGTRRVPIESAFDGRIRIEPGEFVLQAHIPERILSAPFNHVKKTSSEKIDYPLVSVSALSVPEGVRLAVSGLLDHPFRSKALEAAYNNRNESVERRLHNVLRCLPGKPLSDYQGSAEYRLFVFKRTLAAMMEVMDS